MKTILKYWYLLCLLCLSATSPAQNPQPTQEWGKMYGDSLDQTAKRIKAFGDGVYVLGETTRNGMPYGTFSKFDPATGNLVWDFRMDRPGFFDDFDWDPTQDVFIIVGGTVPNTAASDNASWAILVDDTGLAKRYREFRFIGREALTNVVYHPAAPDPLFPFYLLGRKNPASNAPSTFDEAILLNIDLNLAEKWEHEFLGPIVGGQQVEIEGFRGLVPLSNGELLILGNGSIANEGVIVMVDALTGFATNALYYPDFIDFYDGVELPNGEIALVGERFQSREAIMMIIEPANYTPVAGMIFSTIERFEEVGLANPGTNGGEYPLYAVGRLKNSSQNENYLHKVDYNPGVSISLEYARHLPAADQAFADPQLHVTPNRNRIFYADSRVDPTIVSPNRDLFVGNFSLDFDPVCFADVPSPHLGYTVNPVVFQYNVRTKIPGTDILSLFVPTQPIPYTCYDRCVPPPVCSADFTAVSTCCDATFTSTSTGVAPFTYSWDIGCDGVADGIGNVPTFTYSFPFPGTFQVCLTVTDATGCSQQVQKSVTVVDNPPVFNCQNVVVPTDPGECYATYLPVIDVMDDCSAPLRPFCVFSGAINGQGTLDSFPKGVTTVNCFVEDFKGQTDTCQFTITVEDREPPQITCPAPAPVTVPGCDGGARVGWRRPSFSDNCPMASISSTHQPEDFFPCGVTTVTYTVTDMAGLTTTSSFPVTVNCECAELIEANLRCTEVEDQYDFAFLINDLTGAVPSNCDATITTQAGVVVSNVTVMNGVVRGKIDLAAAPIPTVIRLSVRVECKCPDGTLRVCTIPLFLTVPCCKSIRIDDQEQCRATDKVSINLLGCQNLFDVRQVRYYVSDAPCVPGAPMTLIQVSQSCRPLELAPGFHNGDVCVYAEVDMGPGAGPCRQLRTDTALVKLCSPVSCSLADQTFCYAGTPIVPNVLSLSINDPDTCAYTIQWFDANGPIAGETSFTYQPPALQMAASSTACGESFTYRAEITSICGMQHCSATITLDNNDAPTGEIVLHTPDTNPLCYGEDAILEYVRNCQKPSDRWTWQQRTTSTSFSPITTNGTQNPLYQTNRLYEDHWYRILEQNGVCPVDTVDYFLDVIDLLQITSFTATHGTVCAPTQIDMTVDWTPGFTPADPCDYKVVWYHDGNVVFTQTASAGPLSLSYQPSAPAPLAGNFYVEIFSNCCDQVAKSPVVSLDPPMEVLVAGPCFRCKDEFIKLTGIVLNVPPGVTCTYQWYTAGAPIPGANSIDLHVDPGFYGPIDFEVTCSDGCVRTASYVINQCGPGAAQIPVSTRNLTLLRTEAYPNPTQDRITIELEEAMAFGELEILSITGQLVKTTSASRLSTRHEVDLTGLPAGTYLIRGFTRKGELMVVKVIKE
ncbi:MAG: HYR domain-containing protein [Bacteroidota bacterium]